jgi:hypothetical protein
LRSDKVGVLEAHWIAATLWNKALDYYAYVSLQRLWRGAGKLIVVRRIWLLVINGFNMQCR